MKQKRHHPWLKHLLGVSVLSVMLLGVLMMVGHRRVSADEYQPLIDALSKQIQDKQALVKQKQAEGDTLQNKLEAVRADLAAARANLEMTRLQVSQNKARQSEVQRQLKKQTDLLGENIAVVYRQGAVTPLELIAGSQNLSQYVDKQQYINSLREKINQTLDDIERTKKQLDSLEIDLRIKENAEKLQEKGIAEKESELAQLLEATRGEEQKYREMVKSDQAQLNTLRAQQAAAIAAQSAGRTYTSTTDYPWASVEPFPSWGVDPWGFYYRQCTSFAAWRRANLGKPIPSWGFMGPADAKTWSNWGRQFNMRVDDQPEVGAIGVYGGGEYGHVMIVESVLKDGQQVLVSEFNANWDGRYSQSLWPANVLTYIH
ncbi:CHAP domain-containing protein [Patescibacteria group bacterium]|nr:MAG: CHAP domain-containing protein [Patescibacteria group bacterium]